jgi:DNA-binding response OmpR family regulator
MPGRRGQTGGAVGADRVTRCGQTTRSRTAAPGPEEPVVRVSGPPLTALVLSSQATTAGLLLQATAAVGLVGLLCERYGDACGRLERSPVRLLIVDAGALGADPRRALRHLLDVRAVPTLAIADPWQPGLREAGASAVVAPATEHHEVLAAQLVALAQLPVLAPRPLSQRYGPLTHHPGRRCISFEQRPLSLTVTQVRLLSALIEARGELVPTADLERRLWGEPSFEGRRLHTHVQRLRRRLADEHVTSNLVLTVRGEGYRLRA